MLGFQNEKWRLGEIKMLRVDRLLCGRAWTLPRRVLEYGMNRVGTSLISETDSSDHPLHTGLTGEALKAQGEVLICPALSCTVL